MTSSDTAPAPRADTLTTSSPRRPPAATVPGVLIALVLVAVAVVGVHDLLAVRGVTSDGAWVDGAVAGLDGLRAQAWTTVVGVVVALLGLWLLWTALRPARRTHQATPMDDGDVWISKRAIARLATQAAERTTGVESAQTDVRRRTIKVRTTTGAAGDPDAIRERVQDNVRTALHGFSDHRVTVRTKAARDVG